MAEDIDITDLYGSLAVVISKVPLNDSTWVAFGFKGGLPKYGKSFIRFKNKANVAAEDFLFKELTLLAIIDAIKGITENVKSIDQQILILSGILAILVPRYNEVYDSKNFEYLKCGVQDYSTDSKPHEIFFKRASKEFDLINKFPTMLVTSTQLFEDSNMKLKKGYFLMDYKYFEDEVAKADVVGEFVCKVDYSEVEKYKQYFSGLLQNC